MPNPGPKPEGPNSEGREVVGNSGRTRNTNFPFCTPLTFLLDGGRMLPSKFRQMTLLVYANLE